MRASHCVQPCPLLPASAAAAAATIKLFAVGPAGRRRYDSHRESILRSGERYQAGGGGYEGGQRPEDEEDLFQ